MNDMFTRSVSYKILISSVNDNFNSFNQTELEEAADLVLFIMDHTFLADDHLALNETTFTWPERIIPIIKMRRVAGLRKSIKFKPLLSLGKHEC